MSDTNPSLSPKGRTDLLERQQRQAEALRANLSRRKAQARAREETQTEDKPPEAE